MRTKMFLTIVLCALSLAIACVSGTQTNTGKKKKGPNETVRIGFSMDTLKEERKSPLQLSKRRTVKACP